MVHIDYKMNDLIMLKRYNQHCARLAHSNVYCANDNPYGVAVEIQNADADAGSSERSIQR